MVRDRWEAEFTVQSIFISHGCWLLGLISTHIQKKKLCGQEINKWCSKLPIFLVPLWKEREAEITTESKKDERSKELLNIQGQDMWFTGFAKGRLGWSTQDLLNVHGQRMSGVVPTHWELRVSRSRTGSPRNEPGMEPESKRVQNIERACWKDAEVNSKYLRWPWLGWFGYQKK